MYNFTTTLILLTVHRMKNIVIIQTNDGGLNESKKRIIKDVASSCIV